MSIYSIKIVPGIEKHKLLQFIDEHWKNNHALVKSEALLKFQHYDKANDSFNFIVAENNETGEYDALVGFIPLAQYDNTLKEEGNYWGAIWKYRTDIQNSEINNAAFFIWKKLFKLPYFQSYGAIGISEDAKKIYVASRLNLGYLSHYYILNDQLNSFQIAGNVLDIYKCPQKELSKDNLTARWTSLGNIHTDIAPCYRPYKSLSYFRNRYERHPIYSYRFIGIYQDEELVTLLACRVIEVGQSKCIRIIDVLGRLFGSFYDSLKDILYAENAEYIDFLNYGIDKSLFLQTGFNELDLDGELIIPNYFEPFEKKNIRIDLAYKAKFDGYVAFKGDSDQDRPNLL